MNAIKRLKAIGKSSCEKDSSYMNCMIEEIYGIANTIEAEYMEIPKDKNGDVIHIGDSIRLDDGYIDKVYAFDDEGNVVTIDGTYSRADNSEIVKPEQPDSMESIKADALKEITGYWACNEECNACDVTVDGKTPRQMYRVNYCNTAMRLDLIARTEALLGGEQE